MGIASKMAAYASPAAASPSTPINPHPSSSNPFADSSHASVSTPATSSAPAASSSHPANGDHMDPALPDEPPPAYTPAASAGQSHVQAGPSRMDFSGPPPMPDRLENQITGVGIGYGPRRDHGGLDTGESGFSAPSHPPPRPLSGENRLQPPPPPARHPSQQFGKPSSSSGAKPPPHGQSDTSPTEMPTPGRPLLRNGMLLVYPRDFFCTKCGNTGYKNNDPGNPHDADWRKYGKPYTGALAHSYTLAPSSTSNPSTQSAQNFQRPLPQIGQNQAAWNHRPPQGVWDHPGNNRPPPPPPMMHHNSSHGPGPGPGYGQMHSPGPPPPSMIMTGSGWMPPGAVVVQPGDARLGGQLCFRCGGRGREYDFLGFDSGKCWQCRGVGRTF